MRAAPALLGLHGAEPKPSILAIDEHRYGSSGLRVDGLVNCAGIVVHADPLETSWADWEKIFRVNLFGAYEASRLVAKSMIASGARGAIVNVASEAGKRGTSSRSPTALARRL